MFGIELVQPQFLCTFVEAVEGVLPSRKVTAFSGSPRLGVILESATLRCDQWRAGTGASPAIAIAGPPDWASARVRHRRAGRAPDCAPRRVLHLEKFAAVHATEVFFDRSGRITAPQPMQRS